MPWRPILPTNPFKTLKSRLLGWLIFPLLLLSLAHLSSIYVNTKRTSTELFDKLLVTLALSISEYAISSEGDLLTVDLLQLIRQTTNDKLYYKVLGPNGSFLVGYNDMPEPAGGIKQINNHIELYDAVYLGEPVRVIAVSMLSEHSNITGWTKTLVAQTIKDRNQYVLDTMADNLLRLIILIVIATALLSLGISRALKPLGQLQKALDKRDIHDLAHLETKELPQEIATLANSINELFSRLAEQIGLTKRFLENASHQLRTPIAALTLQCDVALRRSKSNQGSSDEEATGLFKIKQNADRITRLTNQLLHLSYSEAAAFNRTKNDIIDLAGITAQCIQQFQESISHGESTAETLISSNLESAIIDGNDALIIEAVNNLLENAYKYGGSSMTITASTYSRGENSILEIKDGGPGIAPEMRQMVTERFFRASNDHDGSGLGLAIVKEVALVHRGKMEITDGDGGTGTCIRCIFPNALET